MDYEKKYKEALERARIFKEHLIEINQKGFADEMEYIFQELKESEDERIRKHIISVLEDCWQTCKNIDYDSSRIQEDIAWLENKCEQSICNTPSKEIIFAIWELGNDWKELTDGSISTAYGTQLDYIQNHWNESEYYLRSKQGEQKHTIEMKSSEESLGIDSATYNKIVDEVIYGEQKPTDKVEPKFKVGDWVIWKNNTYLITANKYRYDTIDQKGYETNFELGTLDEEGRLWSIKDAKNGDVLSDEFTIFIFKDLLSDGSVMTYCDYDTDSDESDAFFHSSVSLMCSKIIPATNEQRDVLFAKMRDAGYVWDDKNKEVRKIEKQGEQKPAGSEEDEHTLQGVIDEIQANKSQAPDYDLATYDRFLFWLKSLKERISEKPKEEVDGFDAKLNALLKKYEYLPKEELAECLEFYLKVVGEPQSKLTHEDICKAYGIPDIGEFSDGYHTFNDLYHQRMILFAVLVKVFKDKAWKSWKHEDGELCFGGGWFIVGIDTPEGAYTYHYKAKDWDRFDCAALEKAKHWDGHTDADVERLFSLLQPSKSEIENIEGVNKDKQYQSIMQMLQSIYEILMSINEKIPMKIIPYTPQPLTPFYDTNKPYCDTTNKIDDDK